MCLLFLDVHVLRTPDAFVGGELRAHCVSGEALHPPKMWQQIEHRRSDTFLLEAKNKSE